MLETAQGLAVSDRLAVVNEFFNRQIRFASDQETWGVADYWATPLEVLARGQGDCEDFAIAKYVSLLMTGVPPEALRLHYVSARFGGPTSTIRQAHMVLAFYSDPAAEPLILDNLASAIRPASSRSDLTPVFSFNSQGLWVGADLPSAAEPLDRLSRWRSVFQRMSAELLTVPRTLVVRT